MRRLKGTAGSLILCGLALFSSESAFADTAQTPATSPKEDNLSYTATLILDGVVPGFGSFYTGATGRGVAVAIGRVFTAYSAYEFWVEAQEYRSVAKAARVAELYYGPGYRYQNPYGPGFIYPRGTARTGSSFTADQYQHMADRRIFLVSLSLTLHAVIWASGMMALRSDLNESEEKRLPIFDIGPDGKPGKVGTDGRGGVSVRAGMQFFF